MNSVEVRRLVLEAAANDYEQWSVITLEIVHCLGVSDTMGANPSEMINSVLFECLDAGEIKAYELSSSTPFATEVDASEETLHELWFLTTQKGHETLRQLDPPIN